MDLKFIIIIFVAIGACPWFVEGEGHLVRHNEGDDIELMYDGKRIMPDPSCPLGVGLPNHQVHSACYIHCILLGHGAGSCIEDTKKCECYGQGPPPYYSKSYAEKFGKGEEENVISETMNDPDSNGYMHMKINVHQGKNMMKNDEQKGNTEEEYDSVKNKEEHDNTSNNEDEVIDEVTTTMSTIEENQTEEDEVVTKSMSFGNADEDHTTRLEFEASPDEIFEVFEKTTEYEIADMETTTEM